MHSKPGFTLLELMIVVAIIAFMSVAAFVMFAPAYAKTRDARRLTDMKDLQAALQLSYLTYNHFPIIPNEISLNGSDLVNTTLHADGDLRANLIDPVVERPFVPTPPATTSTRAAPLANPTSCATALRHQACATRPPDAPTSSNFHSSAEMTVRVWK